MPCETTQTMCKECVLIARQLISERIIPQSWWMPIPNTSPLLIQTKASAPKKTLDLDEFQLRDYVYIALKKHLWENKPIHIFFFAFMGRTKENDEGDITTPISILVDVPKDVEVDAKMIKAVIEELRANIVDGAWEYEYMPDHATKNRLVWLKENFTKDRMPATFRKFTGTMPELHTA
ncbi:hypothetical protein BDW68DRAFT_179444 [Aspergillus falconensis]